MGGTIWDSILEGQDVKRDREQKDLQSFLLQQKSDDDSQHSHATTRMLNENADTVSWERQQNMQEAQDKAYGAIQSALDNGDTDYADYLARTHLGTKLEDLTPPDNGTLPLTFGDEGRGQQPSAPQQQAPSSEPSPPRSSASVPQSSALADQRMYGPQATPDIMANAASLDFKRDPGAGREAWMQDHPGEAGTPGSADIEQYMRSQAAAKQQAAMAGGGPTQPPPFVPQAGQRPAPMVPQASPAQPQQPPQGQIQAAAQTYSPQVQAEQARRYRAGDIVFDPGARQAAKERAALKAAKERDAQLEQAKSMAPAIADFLTQNAAMKRMGIDTGKSGEEYFKGDMAGKNQAAKFRDLKDLKLSLEAADHENDMAEIGLKNRGSLSVAETRAHKGKGAAAGPGGPGGVEMLDAKGRAKALQQLTSEKRAFTQSTNYPKILDRYQRGQAALQAVNSGNPVGTGLAIEALISSHRGGAATQAFLKQFQENQSSVAGRLDTFAERAASGDYGAEAKNNIRRASEEQLSLLREEANQLKQGWSKSAFSGDRYGMKGNYENLHDELWTPFGFEPIKRDANGGSVQITGQRRPGHSPAAPSQTIGEKLMGKPKKRAEDMLDELVSK